MNSMVRLIVAAAAALMLAAPAGTAASIPSKPLPDLLVLAAASGDSITVFSTKSISSSFSVWVSGGWRTDGPCNEYVPAFKLVVPGISVGTGIVGVKKLSIPAVNTIRNVFVDSGHVIAESNEHNNTDQVPGGYVC